MSDNKYSLNSFLSFLNDNFSLLIIVLAVFVGGFLSGSLWKENKMSTQGPDQAQPEVAGAENPQQPEGPSEETLKKMPEVTAEDYVRGAENPELTIVEYSSFLCGYCGRFFPTLDQIVEEYGDQVAWVYRHYGSNELAELSECVGEYSGEEKFWEFTETLHSTLAEDSSVREIENAIELAVDIGADKETMQACVDNGEFEQRVQDQTAGGRAAGVSGTPNSILVTSDGEYRMIIGAQPYSNVKAAIEELL